MIKVVVLCALVAVAVGFETERNQFSEWSVEELKSLMGTRLDVPIPVEQATFEAAASIPKSFDARDAFGSCIHPIRNQMKCGSCWAFGAAESFSDRLCIATHNKTDVILSPEDLVSCDTVGNHGCQGGIPHLAWDFMEVKGLVSDKCFPYTAGQGTPAACTNKCVDSEKWTPYKVKLGSTKGYKSVEAIQTAIMNDGPVEAAFQVYQDFMSYKSGVYEHKTGSLLGGHAVKMLGWGTEGGVDYWLMANSWDTTWGDNGYFKIKRGSNECGIEQMVCAGLPAATEEVAVQGDSKLCTECKKVADAVVSKLINLVFQGTVVGGCGELCSKLDKPTEQKICDGICVLAGEVTFEEAIQKAQLNPEHLCVDLKICSEE